MLLPVNDILKRSEGGDLRLWHNRADQVPDGDHNIVAESWLLFSNLCRLTIAKEGRTHMVCLLYISLNEELVEEEIGPLSECVKLTRWC